MLIFSCRKILIASNKKSVEFLRILRYLADRDVIPQNGKDPLYKYMGMNFSGQDFLINPMGVLNDLDATYNQKVEYVLLAGLRKLGTYLMEGDKTLSIGLCPMPSELITANKLLAIEKGRIIFKHE